MKKLILSALFIGTILTSSAASAGFYANARAGISYLDNIKPEAVKIGGTPTAILDSDKDDNFSTYLGGAVGYGYSIPLVATFRTELEYLYHSPYTNKITVATGTIKDKYKHQSLMLNGGVDLNVLPLLKPYAVAGIGVTRTSIDRETSIVGVNNPKSSNDTTFMAGAGIAASALGIISGDFGYRYRQVGTGSDAIKMHELTIGGRLSF